MTKFLTKAALAATVATGLFAAPALAGNSDTKPFTATARIIKPLTLTLANGGLDFGTITMGAGLVSSVVSVAQDDTAFCGANLTCTAPSAAQFTVAGVGAQDLDVSVVAPATLDYDDGVTVHTVNFNADAPAGLTLLADGSGSFAVGGDITVVAGTTDGTYTADVDVTVSYL